MKTVLTVAILAVSPTTDSALTTKYTSELEPYTTATKAAALSDDEFRLALNVISSDATETEKRAYIRRLVK